MATDEKSGKKIRGILKGAFTRNSKTVYTCMGRKLDVEEIVPFLKDVKESFQNLEKAHQGYLIFVDDDKLEEEDSWLDASKHEYDELLLEARNYERDIEKQNNTQASFAQTHKRKIKVKAEKADKPIFSGKYQDYFQFKKDFVFIYYDDYDEDECLYCLKRCLPESARKWLDGVSNLLDAWTELDQQYGDARVVSDSILEEFQKAKPITDTTKFIEHYHRIHRACTVLEGLKRSSDLDNSTTLALLESKFSYLDREKWARYQMEKSIPADIKNLLAFMRFEMNIRRIAGSDVRSGSGNGEFKGDHKSGTGNKSGKVGVVNFQNSTPPLAPEPGAGAPSPDNKKPDFKPGQAAWSTNCWVCKGIHQVEECAEFMKLSPELRLKRVMEAKACYFCLRQHFGYSRCKRRKPCAETDCKFSHHRSLHGAFPEDEKKPATNLTGHEYVLDSESNSGILPVLEADLLSQKGLCKPGVVFFDGGASLSLIRQKTAEELGLKGTDVSLTLTKVGASEEQFNSKLYTVFIKSKLDRSVHKIQAAGIPDICGKIEKIDQIELDNYVKRFKLDISELSRPSGPVDVLIGVDQVFLHSGKTLIDDSRELALRQTPLGPVIFGSASDQAEFPHENADILVCKAVCKTEPVNIDEFMASEDIGVAINPCCVKQGSRHALSGVERAEDEMIRKSAIKIGNRWMIPIPWCKDIRLLPNNYSQALARLKATEKKLSGNPEYAALYGSQIQDLVERGCARKMTEDELKNHDGPVFYLGHHAVIRPEKTTPCRLVFNSAASFRGHILNEYQHKGPDLLNNLLGVLIRFRENAVAVCGDVRKMYHQILVRPVTDANLHRFLWRNMEQNRAPDIYKKLVLTFGDKCSPALANTAMDLTAEEHSHEHPEAAESVLECRYMDDICDSFQTVDLGSKRISEIDTILEKGHFAIKEWVSNENLSGSKNLSPKVQLRPIAASDEKVLGISWNRELDELFITSKTPKVLANLEPLSLERPLSLTMTKRMVLSVMAGVFDILGYVAPFLVKGKIGLQELWKKKVGWDEDLADSDKEFWYQFFFRLRKIDSLHFPRCLTPQGAVGKPTLVIQCDAATGAYGSVAHVRWQVGPDDYEARFIMAKGRVAPVRQLGIPKLELNSCVLGARLKDTIVAESRFEFEKVRLHTDSKIALAWINSESRTFKPYVSVRQGEILTKTDAGDWHHVPSEHNTSDLLTRGIDIDELAGRWTDGEAYFRRPEEEWPLTKSELEKEDIEAIESECQPSKHAQVNVVTKGTDYYEEYVQRFSSLKRLILVTAMKNRYLYNLKAKTKKKPIVKGIITPDELIAAERELLLHAQRKLPLVKKLKKFRPTLNDDGIVIVNARTDQLVSFENYKPPILPRKAWLSLLIVRHVHQFGGHPGVAATAAKVRRKYWMLGVTKLAKTVCNQCTFCREWCGKTEHQIMSDLPLDRLLPQTPPFHISSVDFFGPLYTKIGRKTYKVYGVIFTCLNTRAVYVDVAHDYSTPAFHLVLRRFFAMHGYPHTLWSDRGSQLVGCDAELRRMVQGWNADELKQFSHSRRIEWKFFTPTAAHQNGCVEALVKTTKRCLKKALAGITPSPGELQTTLFEVATLVNSRPIGILPNDPGDGPFLCPNDLLLGRASDSVPQGPFFETTNLKHRFEFVQNIVGSWWKNWYRDVFPSLVPRKKWLTKNRDVKIGDVILVKDKNPIRGQYTRGLITNVFPGRDGYVRNVEVKTAFGTYERPITCIVVICPVDGDS